MTQHPVRIPRFMEETVARRKVVPATFGRTAARHDSEPRPTFTQSAHEAPPPPAPTPDAAIALLASAIESLRQTAERLAEQARSDALEVGFQVARRILEMEVSSSSPEPLFALIRSALRKAGEVREVTVRLSPGDEVRIRAALTDRPDALSTATVRLESDGSLSPGDCIVEGEFGSVDGRLSTRLDEMQTAVSAAVGQGRVA